MQDINNELKWSSFVNKLIKETKVDHIEWENLSELTGTTRDRIIGPVFSATINGNKKVAIYRYRFDHYFDEDKYEIREGIRMEFVDDVGNRLWQIPYVSDQIQLMDLVEFKTAEIEDILEEFLNNES